MQLVHPFLTGQHSGSNFYRTAVCLFLHRMNSSKAVLLQKETQGFFSFLGVCTFCFSGQCLRDLGHQANSIGGRIFSGGCLYENTVDSLIEVVVVDRPRVRLFHVSQGFFFPWVILPLLALANHVKPRDSKSNILPVHQTLLMKPRFLFLFFWRICECWFSNRLWVKVGSPTPVPRCNLVISWYQDSVCAWSHSWRKSRLKEKFRNDFKGCKGCPAKGQQAAHCAVVFGFLFRSAAQFKSPAARLFV